MSAQPTSQVVPDGLPRTIEEYFSWEAGQEQRHEWAGRVVLMSGGSDLHDLVTQRINQHLLNALDAGPCRVYSQNRQLLTLGGAHSRYPDVLVRCRRDDGDDPNRDRDADLAIEVLSPSSTTTDLVEKLDEYGGVPGLRQYLVVDPVREYAFLYERHDLGWNVVEYGVGQAAGPTVTVVDVPIDLADVFAYARRKLDRA